MSIVNARSVQGQLGASLKHPQGEVSGFRCQQLLKAPLPLLGLWAGLSPPQAYLLASLLSGDASAAPCRALHVPISIQDPPKKLGPWGGPIAALQVGKDKPL